MTSSLSLPADFLPSESSTSLLPGLVRQLLASSLPFHQQAFQVLPCTFLASESRTSCFLVYLCNFCTFYTFSVFDQICLYHILHNFGLRALKKLMYRGKVFGNLFLLTTVPFEQFYFLAFLSGFGQSIF